MKARLDRASLGLIRLYQRHVSPRKGFACAHRVLHGGDSCSGFAAAQIEQHGLVPAVRDIRRRFQGCERAASVLCMSESRSNARDGGLSDEGERRREEWLKKREERREARANREPRDPSGDERAGSTCSCLAGVGELLATILGIIFFWVD